MGRYARRKGKGTSCKGIGKRGGKTKTRTRDFDQIKSDIANSKEFMRQLEAIKKDDEELSDQAYCLPCARFFQDTETLHKHESSKCHKQRLKKLKSWDEEYPEA